MEMSVGKFPVEANGHVCEKEVTIFSGLPMDFFRNCLVCDERLNFTVADGVAKVTTPCPYPEGITSATTVHFPSGKILVTDDIRPIYDGFGHDKFADYNSDLGQAQVITAFAEQGCAFGPVRNTVPGLYRTAAPGKFIIASPDYYEDEDGMEGDPSLPEEDCLATVCTDLWAYSIADYEDWLSRGGDPSKLGWSDSVVEMSPGYYRFTHHTGERGFDWDARGTVIYAHVEYLGKEGRD